MKNQPSLHLFNHQKRIPCRLPLLQRQLEATQPHLPVSRFAWPSRIEITLVTPGVMQRVHRDFFQDPTPTDVITFPHGEILICPAIAAQQAPVMGHTVHREILTYAVHGLLHLLGWNDLTPRGFARMAKEQTRLVDLIDPLKP